MNLALQDPAVLVAFMHFPSFCIRTGQVFDPTGGCPTSSCIHIPENSSLEAQDGMMFLAIEVASKFETNLEPGYRLLPRTMASR